MGRAQHVTKHPSGGWQIKGTGAGCQRSAHSQGSIAINQKSEVVVHGRDGKIRAKDSYGNAPFPPRG